jgi:hypothetical protein
MTRNSAEAVLSLNHSSPDLDVWRAADLRIKQYGADAQSAAALLANARRTKGDRTGERVWLRVMMAVRELRRAVRGGTERLN